jgi:hypothetical protein
MATLGAAGEPDKLRRGGDHDAGVTCSGEVAQ